MNEAVIPSNHDDMLQQAWLSSRPVRLDLHGEYDPGAVPLCGIVISVTRASVWLRCPDASQHEWPRLAIKEVAWA